MLRLVAGLPATDFPVNRKRHRNSPVPFLLIELLGTENHVLAVFTGPDTQQNLLGVG